MFASINLETHFTLTCGTCDRPANLPAKSAAFQTWSQTNAPLLSRAMEWLALAAMQNTLMMQEQLQQVATSQVRAFGSYSEVVDAVDTG